MIIKDRKTLLKESIKPIIEDSELENGIWLDLIPGQLKIGIFQHGVGGTPNIGDFLRVQQIIYLEDMTPVVSDRITYIYGRGKLIQGLQLCLGFAKESFKARIFISSELAYQNKRQPGIPHNSNLVFDIEVSSILKQPSNHEQLEDEQFIGEIMKCAEEGDKAMKQGNLQMSLKYFETAYERIQGHRFKQIRSYLFNKSKLRDIIQDDENQNEKEKERDYSYERDQLAKINKGMDIVKIKAIQMALLNQEYFKVVRMSSSCLQQPRLESSLRIILARSRALSQMGEFNLAIIELEKIKSRYPQEKIIDGELQRVEARKKQYSTPENPCPILLFRESTALPKEKIKIKAPQEVKLIPKKKKTVDKDEDDDRRDDVGFRYFGRHVDYYDYVD